MELFNRKGERVFYIPTWVSDVLMYQWFLLLPSLAILWFMEKVKWYWVPAPFCVWGIYQMVVSFWIISIVGLERAMDMKFVYACKSCDHEQKTPIHVCPKCGKEQW